MSFYKIALSFLISYTPLVFSEEKPPAWKNKTRVKALQHTDLLLNYWSLAKGVHPMLTPAEPLYIHWPEAQTFAKEYGYFSSTKPLVGKVTSSLADLTLVQNLLNTMPKEACERSTFDFAQAEVLTKVLAYRDLTEGQTIFIPIQTSRGVELERFTVDRVFNIWRGMPAFGLIPTSPNTSSLLLFRGTDFSPITKRGLASMISDLDPAGPGLHAFLNARKELKEWLKEVYAEDKPARILGFSLGGALASYTFIYAHAFVSEEASIAICPPGVSSRVRDSFYKLSAKKQLDLITYINAGDFVSQIGHLFGTVYSLSLQESLKPLSAHTALFSASPLLYRTQVKSR